MRACTACAVLCRRGRNGSFAGGAEKYEDESFVLPALIRFNGEPSVDDDGRLLYKFPDLQVCFGGEGLTAVTVHQYAPLVKEVPEA